MIYWLMAFGLSCVVLLASGLALLLWGQGGEDDL